MSSSDGDMTPAALRRFGECLERGDADGATACFTEDAVYEEPPRFAFTGRPALRAFIADFLTRHTDVRFTIERALASFDGALLAAEWRWSYVSLDGAAHAFAGMCFLETRDGLIARWRGYSAAIA